MGTYSGQPGSYSGVSIGGPGLIAITVSSFSIDYSNLTGATIGGITANRLSASAYQIGCSVIYARITAGTTTDVVLNFDQLGPNVIIGVYRLENILSDTPSVSNTAIGEPVLSLSCNLTGVSANTCVISTIGQNNGDNRITWTGVNENFDYDNSTLTGSAGSIKQVSPGNLNISASQSVSYTTAMVSIGWT